MKLSLSQRTQRWWKQIGWQVLPLKDRDLEFLAVKRTCNAMAVFGVTTHPFSRELLATPASIQNGQHLCYLGMEINVFLWENKKTHWFPWIVRYRVDPRTGHTKCYVENPHTETMKKWVQT